MAVMISLLRGVNVGGHNKIKMAKLRKVYESLDLADPHTYVQSGNVVFRTEEKDLTQLAIRIEKGIEHAFGFRPAVILRTLGELRDVAARNPFLGRDGIDPKKLLVTFLASHPSEAGREKVRSMESDPEEVLVDRRELFIYFPNGMARPKLSVASIEKLLSTPGTGRNWNSVTKILEMAEEMEAAG